MLKIADLTKSYSKSNVLAVKNLSLELNPGEIFGFIGPNGAGKSTTIKCITGILPFNSGSITVCDKDIRNNSVAAKKNIGYVPDDSIIYDKLSGLEYINFIADMYGVSTEERKSRLDNLLNKFNLTKDIGRQIKGFSHGMKQKTSVIAALIHNPKLWVLDEPLTGLDPQSAFELKEMMKDHAKAGNTVMFSSHVLDVVEKLCDRVGIINKGELVVVCDIKDLKKVRSDMSLEDYFLQITDEAKA